jgi:hypothetical protein
MNSISAQNLRMIIKEERQRLDDERLIRRALYEQASRLRNEGLPNDELVDLMLEGWWSDFFGEEGLTGKVFGGAQEAVKAKLAEGIIDVILKAFGLQPSTPMGQFGRNLGIQIAENFEWLRWRSYFGDGACDRWADLVQQALLEEVIFEPIFDAVASGMGVIPTGQSAARPTVAGTMSTQNLLGGIVYTSVREAITETLNDHMPYTLGSLLCKIEGRDVAALVAGTTPELRGIRAELEKQTPPEELFNVPNPPAQSNV